MIKLPPHEISILPPIHQRSRFFTHHRNLPEQFVATLKFQDLSNPAIPFQVQLGFSDLSRVKFLFASVPIMHKVDDLIVRLDAVAGHAPMNCRKKLHFERSLVRLDEVRDTIQVGQGCRTVDEKALSDFKGSRHQANLLVWMMRFSRVAVDQLAFYPLQNWTEIVGKRAVFFLFVDQSTADRQQRQQLVRLLLYTSGFFDYFQ